MTNIHNKYFKTLKLPPAPFPAALTVCTILRSKNVLVFLALYMTLITVLTGVYPALMRLRLASYLDSNIMKGYGHRFSEFIDR